MATPIQQFDRASLETQVGVKWGGWPLPVAHTQQATRCAGRLNKAAASVGCPIVPVALRGTRRFLEDGTYLPRPSRITLTICPPIEPQGASETPEWQEVVRLRDATRQAISRQAGEAAV